MSKNTSKSATRIFISVAEASGDMHAARLIAELHRQIPDVICSGLGGTEMANAGCELLDNLVDRSAMLLHAIREVPFYFCLLRRVKRFFREHRPDVVVTIDSFEWNCHIAKAAHKLGIPVITYIAPQLWAWGPWRARKVRKNIDKIACILPFETDWFAKRDIDAQYVGHPLFEHEQVPAMKPEPRDFPVIALLSGSRKQEIARLFQPMQQIALAIKQRYSTAKFLTVASNAQNANLLRESADPALGIEFCQSSVEEVTAIADLAIVASGTATLQTASQACPMVIMYYVNWLQWHLAGRWLLTTKYLSLVNILAGEELVPEFMPFFGDTEGVTNTVLELLSDDNRRAKMREQLRDLIEPLRQSKASVMTAAMIKELAKQSVSEKK